MEEELMIRKAASSSMVSAMVGRAMTTVLSCRPKKLEDAIGRLGHAPVSSSVVSLEESLWFLYKYVRDAAEREEQLDEVLVPMIEHSLKFKDSKNANQAAILLKWLLQDQVFFEALAKEVVGVILRKEDHYIALGWCALVRGIVQYHSTVNLVALLRIICSSFKHLINIVCNGSVLQDGFQLPTRLAVAAADCILVISGALTERSLPSTIPGEEVRKERSPELYKKVGVLGEKHRGKNHLSSDGPDNIQMNLLLWESLDQLISLVKKIHCWSRKSRPLHAKGLGEVHKWLKEIKNHYGFLQDGAGYRPSLEAGALLLSSCWKHYSILLLMEGREFPLRVNGLLDQYISGIQFFSEEGAEVQSMSKEGSRETRKFFLNCLALILGRLNSKKIEIVMQDYGTQISSVLLAQLQNADDDVLDVATCIFKFAVFKSSAFMDDLSGMESIVPSLLHLLDKRDGASRAAVVLLAEYCSIGKNSWCLQQVMKHCTSGNVQQRQNAVDFMSEIISIFSNSARESSDSIMKDVATHLVNFLGDEESVIRREAITILPMTDPLVVLPSIVSLISSENGTIGSAASDAFIQVLKHNSQSFDVISLTLDCLSNHNKGYDHRTSLGEVKDVSMEDINRVFRLIPEWSESVQQWNSLIEPLMEKMLCDTSNAIVVRFMSCISEHLADSANLVLGRMLLHAKEQEMSTDIKTCMNDNSEKLQKTLFDRLSPLLIIKLLPLRIFDDLNSTIMYGKFITQGLLLGSDDSSDFHCVASYLLSRAFCEFEYEEIRKLATELCGRIHPQVLYKVAPAQLESAAELKDTLKIKACLFFICTSLKIRGGGSILHPELFKIRKVLQTILLWPALDGDEVAKSQHGCIDCLALMICAELQTSKSSPDSTLNKSLVNGKTTSNASTHALVIDYLINGRSQTCETPKEDENYMSKTLFPIPFRLCMANVLISACQKISDVGKKKFAKKTFPCLIKSLEVDMDAQVRAACIQVLFSAVYRLKLTVLPYASDLLNVSLESLKRRSQQEKIAGAKLIASLMASEDAILHSLSGRLLEVRSVLLMVSESDPSLELRQICQKLLICLTSSQ